MQIELKPDEYQVIGIKTYSRWSKIWRLISQFSSQFGGWKLTLGLCGFFFMLSLIILPSQNDYLLWGANTHPEVLTKTLGHKIILREINQNPELILEVKIKLNLPNDEVLEKFLSEVIFLSEINTPPYTAVAALRSKYQIEFRPEVLSRIFNQIEKELRPFLSDWSIGLRWLTAVFLHLGLLHLAFNMFGAYIMGSFLEKIWNAKVVFLLVFISGILGNVATYYLWRSNSVGASGGIFGLMGALVAYFFLNRKLERSVREYMLKQLGILVLINVGMSLIVPNIDIVGHLGGLFSGLGLGALFYYLPGLRREKLLMGLWVLSLTLILGAFIYTSVLYFQFG